MKKELKTVTRSLLVMGTVFTLSACPNSNSSSQSTNTKDLKKSMSWMTTSEIQTLDQSKMVDTTSGEQAKMFMKGYIDKQITVRLYQALLINLKQVKMGSLGHFI